MTSATTRPFLSALVLSLIAALALPAGAAASAAPPAGGADIGQIVIATVAAGVLTTFLLVFGLGHRSGRTQLLGRVAGFASRASGLPAWAALPTAVAGVSLVTAVFGLYWDVSLHIDNGRDPGPLANPSHYFILAGLFGIFSAGWFALVLPTERPGPSALRITRDWEVPVGGVMMMACASFALMGFPLDDMWHRLFGQDVTLWGPTHMMMLTGAALTLIGIHSLLAEARLGNADRAGRDAQGIGLPLASLLVARWAPTARLVAACGGLLIGLSIYQGEFDYGVAQFRLLFDPVLITLAAGTALVAARVLVGRGGAFGAVAFYLVVRSALTLIVGPLFGETVAHFPLYLAEAAIVEATAFAVAPRAPYRFAVVSGVLVGSLGVLAEYGWSHVWAFSAWPAHILPSAIALSVPVGVAGGVIGAFIAGALGLRPEVSGSRRALVAAGTSLAVVAGVCVLLLQTSVPDARATVALTDVGTGSHGREVMATVRFDPASVADDADWLSTIAWQGKEPVRVAPLKKIAPGVWRTTEPLPASGTWKSAIRLHRGRDLASVPVYLPADPAIPVAGVPATAHFERALTGDHVVLQRERKDGIPGWLWTLASTAVMSMIVGLMVLLAWGLARIARAAGDVPEPRRAAAADVPRTMVGAGA